MKIKKLIFIIAAVSLILLMIVPANAATLPNKITLSNTNISIVAGDSMLVYAKFSPYDEYEGLLLEWSSSNEKIATVAGSGTIYNAEAGIWIAPASITANSEGTATITVKSENGKTAKTRVTVKKTGEKLEVKALEISIQTLTVRLNQTRQLVAIANPVDAYNQEVYWSSDNNKVAWVEDDGSVTGKSPGTAVITAESVNGKKATCTVTVLDKESIELVDVNPLINIKKTTQITATELKSAIEKSARQTANHKTGIASFKNQSTISAALLKTAASTAKDSGKNIKLRFNTTGTDGKIKAALTLDPALFTERNRDLHVRISTESEQVKNIKSRMEKHYKNRVAVIECEETGSFGATVSIALKDDLANSEMDNMHFYSYDSATNKFKAIETASCTSDNNGYLIFKTSTAGIIIISDGPLSKK